MIGKTKKSVSFLSGTALKWLALILMTVDHVGLIFYGFFPYSVYRVLRIIGRVSFPIFAYLTAEGFRYTRNRKKYALRFVIFAVLIQLGYFIYAKSLDLNIFFTLALSLLFIWLYELSAKDKRKIPLFFLALLLATVPSYMLGGFYGLSVSYGLFGALLPLFAYVGRSKWERLASFTLGNVLMCLALMNAPLREWQWFCLLSVPVLMLYNGKTGKYRMKYFFYLYYPLHLVLLYGLFMLLK